jgi:valyl-tRNA synthetase
MLNQIEVEISGLPLVTSKEWLVAQRTPAEHLPEVQTSAESVEWRRRFGLSDESEARNQLSKQLARERMKIAGERIGLAASDWLPNNAHWQVSRVLWDGYRRRWLVEFKAGRSIIERVEVSSDLGERLAGQTTVQDKLELKALLDSTLGSLPMLQEEGFAA